MKKWQAGLMAIILLAGGSGYAAWHAVLGAENVAQSAEEESYQAISESVEEASQEIMEVIQEAREAEQAEPELQPEPEPIEGSAEEAQKVPDKEDPKAEQPAPKPVPVKTQVPEPVLLSEEEVLAHYDEGLGFLETLAIEKLDELIANLIEEYTSLPSEERSKLTVKTQLASKYIGLGKDLEGRIDEIFYHMMDELESELVANSLDTGAVSTLTQQYEDTKAQRREEILRKAMDAQ